MLNEEPAQSQDLQMMGMLLPLGIEKGKDFKPDVAPVGIMCQLVQASVSENQAWRSVKFQNEIKVLVLDAELLRIPRGFEGSFDGPCKA
jgi:hypothetical protein